jgi:autotransporter-associated beta strand protein
MKKASSFVLWCVCVLTTTFYLPAQAATLYWSGDGTNPGGTGTWDTTLARWGSSTAGPFTTVWANSTTDIAVIPQPAANATITCGLNITNAGMIQLGGTNTFSPSTGVTILLAGTSPTLTITNKMSFNPPLIKQSGTVTLVKQGPGQLQLNNNGQTFSKYLIKGGIISTANTNKWGSGGSSTADFITLDGGGIGNDSTSQNLNFGITVGAGGGSFGQFATTITNNVLSKITGVGGINFGGGSALSGVNSASYTSAGSYILANPLNDYAGATGVSVGTLYLGANEVIPNTSTLTVSSGATLALNSFNETVAGLTSGGTISGSGTLTVTGSATVSGGTISATNSIGTALTVTGTATLSAPISGASGLRMNGAATSVLTLSGANTFTGDTTNQTGWISTGNSAPFGDGTLRLAGGNLIITANRSAANTITNPVVMTSNCTISNASAATTQILIRSGGPWTISGGTLTIRNPNSATGEFDLLLTNAVTCTRPVIVGVSGDTGLCEMTFNNDGTADQNFSGVISGNGRLRRNTSGGITYLSGANTYSGGTSNVSGYIAVGVDSVGSVGAITSSAIGTGTVIQNGGGFLAFGASRTILNDLTFTGSLSAGGSQDLTFQGPFSLGSANRTITVTNTAMTTISGPVSSTVAAGANALTKAGAGILQITSDNLAAIAGNINVNAGTLRVDNITGSAVGSGNMNIAAGGTLGGNGIIPGIVTNNGALAPGASVGQLNTGNEVWNSASTNIWEINDATGSAGTGWDLLNITGTLTINATVAGPIRIKITSLTGSAPGDAANFLNTSPYSWTIVQTTGGITGFDARKFLLDTTGFSNATGNGGFRLIQSGNNLLLTFTDPTVLTDPADVIVGHGSNAVFNVVASGTSPSYQWQKGGVNLSNGGRVSGATTTSLTIASVQDGDDIGSYSVIVSASSSVTSAAAALIIADPPAIVSNPASSTVGVGTNAVFSVTYTGTSNAVTPMTFRWKTNGINLTESAHFIGTATPSLTVVSALTSDVTSYSVALTNATGTASSSSATLAVDTLPVITIPPSNATIIQGGTTNFTIVASGPHLSYQWQTNGVSIVDDANYIGSTASILTITNAIKADEGSYHCIVSNAAGSVTNTDVLLIIDPAITAQPASVTIECGSTTVLNVTATGAAPLKYQWYTPDATGTALAGETNATLTVNNAHNSSYAVVVTNSNGSITSSTATISTVDTSGPAITLVGSNLVLACQNDPFVDPGFSATDACDGPVSVTTNGSVNTAVAGFYTLTYSATDSSAHLSSTNRVVHIGGCNPVAITSLNSTPPSLVSLAQGTNFNLTVTASGSTPITYQWYSVANGVTNIVTGATNASQNFTAQPISGFTSVQYFVVAQNVTGINTVNTANSALVNVSIVLDPTDPKVSVKSPGKNKRVASVLVSGQATDAKGNVAHVFFKFINHNPGPTESAVHEAPLTFHTAGNPTAKDFSYTVPTIDEPLPGTNDIVVWSQDLAGRTSPNTVIPFFFQKATTFTLNKHGNGTGKVTIKTKAPHETFADQQFQTTVDSSTTVSLFIGQLYSLTYTPDAKTTGSSVASLVTNAPGMTAGVSSTKKVSASILVEANTNSVSFEFDRNRFIDMAGHYNAVFTGDLDNPTFANSRYFNMNLSKTRTVTGYLLDNNKAKASFSHITFGADGSVTIPIGTITINGNLIWSDSGNPQAVKQFVGTATDGSWTAPIIADLANKAAIADGLATMQIPPTNGVPGASGFAFVKAKNGGVSIGYTLADDNKHANAWSMSASKSGNLPQWVITKSGGLLFGTLNASNSLANLSGTQMSWIRPAGNSTYPTLNPAGFVNSPFAIVSSPYDIANGAFSGTYTVTTSGSASSNVLGQVVTFAGGKATPAGLVTAGSLANGVLKITFMDGGANKHKTTAVGTFLENTTNGVGFYIPPGASPADAGTMTLAP